MNLVHECGMSIYHHSHASVHKVALNLYCCDALATMNLIKIKANARAFFKMYNLAAKPLIFSLLFAHMQCKVVMCDTDFSC